MTADPSSSPARTQSAEAPPLRLVFWETTAGCNLECAHCRRLDVSRELMKSDLTTGQGMRLIEQVASLGRSILVFSGGEPLMRPDLFELAAYARERGLLIALATNGTMIDKALARKIADAEFDRVSISLDGADAATHDGLRRQEGSFEGALRAMRLLTAENVAIQINCTIARHNKDQISAMLQLAERLGADALHYFLLVPVGCGEQIFEDQMLTPEEVEERLGEIAELEENTDLQIKPTCAPHYYRITRQRKSRQQNQPASSSGHGHPGGALHSFTKGCLAGTGVCFVSHEGKVFPCGYLPVEAGDVRTMPFDQIWRESSLFGELRDDTTLKGKCSICKFSKVCGGCRARAYHKYQDYLQAEPYCLHQPEPR